MTMTRLRSLFCELTIFIRVKSSNTWEQIRYNEWHRQFYRRMMMTKHSNTFIFSSSVVALKMVFTVSKELLHAITNFSISDRTELYWNASTVRYLNVHSGCLC
mmetsp:Transcript_13687/g.18547  ORF Transcript_13687/g.18547 Transcript_13687/m.18547 type:complete len:103 (+) Transcript_13687:1118-1426(+)